VLHWEK